MNFPHKACRVCLERYVAALIPITDKTSTDMSIYEVIQFVCDDVPVISMIPRNLKNTTIFFIPQVVPGDHYPQYICVYCLRLMEVAFKIKGLFVYSNHILRSSGQWMGRRTDEIPTPEQSPIHQEETTRHNVNSSTDSVASGSSIKRERRSGSGSSDGSEAKRARRSGSSEVTFICKKCSIPFESLDELNKHCAFQHQNLEPHKPKERVQRKPENQCTVCLLILDSRTEMINHKKMMHPDLWDQNQCEFW